MNIVLTVVRINGPINAIFDLVTTARYWPTWHPSTVSVIGVTERPYQLGDTVRQMAHIGGRPRDGVWTVMEHCRPERVTLQMHGGDIEVRYTFSAVEGGTQVIRRLMYTADFVDGGHDLTTFEQLMHSESEVGLLQLKGFVEAILRQEAEHNSS